MAHGEGHPGGPMAATTGLMGHERIHSSHAVKQRGRIPDELIWIPGVPESGVPGYLQTEEDRRERAQRLRVYEWDTDLDEWRYRWLLGEWNDLYAAQMLAGRGG